MSQPAKVCMVCGVDCSTRPRTKDTQGRYTCKACFDAAAAKAAAKPARKPSPAIAQAPPQSAEPEPLDDLSGIIGLDDGPSAPIAAQVICPGCQSTIPHGSTLCVQCGRNLQSGGLVRTAVGVDDPGEPTKAKRGTCGKCGYSLKGLKALKCPECGSPILPEARRTKHAADSAAIRRWEYLKPLIQIAVGIGGLTAILLSQGQSEALIVALVEWGVTIPIGTGVFFLACLIWLGFDAPFHLTALRLAGIFAVVNLVSVVLRMTPLPGIAAWAITMFIYLGMLVESLDMEVVDAVIMSLLITFVKFIIVVVIVVQLMG
ncbi:MAG: hypothetical protein ACKVW3_05705 [Phycisphaerales bacterium]